MTTLVRDTAGVGAGDGARAVAELRISAARTSLVSGDSVRLTAVANDSSAEALDSAAIIWESSEPEVVRVDSTGWAFALGQGAATITAVTDDVRARVLMVVAARTGGEARANTPIDPALPKVEVDLEGLPARAKRQLRVVAGGNLQAAIDSSRAGDEILLPPGATFAGNYILPKRGDRGWVTIRTDTPLPAAGVRMTPEFAANARLTRIETRVSVAAVATAPAASGWRLLGVEIGAAPTLKLMNGIVYMGDGSGAQNTVEKIPSRLVLDRVYIHGHAELAARRCLTLNAAHVAVLSSTIVECHAQGADAQAIVGWNGPGPFLIENNRLEGSGEVILFGGADPAVPDLLPSDIVIRGNHVTRPPSWKGVWTVKNLFELKVGRRVLAEGNLFENNWADGQSGSAILWKTVNQDGRQTWAETSDITFRYNVVRNTAAGFNLAAAIGGHPAVPTARVRISHNYLVDFGAYNGTDNGRAFLILPGISDLQIDHNTIIHNGNVGQSIAFEAGGTTTRLSFRDNVITRGQYGLKGPGKLEGKATLDGFAPGAHFAGNVMLGVAGDSTFYPRGNFFAPSAAAAGLGARVGVAVAAAAGGIELPFMTGGPFRGRGTDGADPGADRTVSALIERAIDGGASRVKKE